MKAGIEASIRGVGKLDDSDDEFPCEAQDQMEAFLEALTGCVAEWCIRNPNLVNAKGEPTKVAGLASVRHLLDA